MAKKLIVIDDSSSARRQVTLALGKAGFDVVEAVDGLDGLKKIEANPDAAGVVCDVNMPNMSGIEFLEAAHGRGSKVPVVTMLGPVHEPPGSGVPPSSSMSMMVAPVEHRVALPGVPASGADTTVTDTIPVSAGQGVAPTTVYV